MSLLIVFLLHVVWMARSTLNVHQSMVPSLDRRMSKLVTILKTLIVMMKCSIVSVQCTCYIHAEFYTQQLDEKIRYGGIVAAIVFSYKFRLNIIRKEKQWSS